MVNRAATPVTVLLSSRYPLTVPAPFPALLVLFHAPSPVPLQLGELFSSQNCRKCLALFMLLRRSVV